MPPWCNALWHCTTASAAGSKSFLLLFFKKEVLAFVPPEHAVQRLKQNVFHRNRAS
jgi:hypothetical protein